MNGQASILLLTFNGEKYLSQVLEMVRRQKVQPLEIIAIDSGSTDGTQEILRQDGVKLETIPQSDFHHAATRNAACRVAAGRFVVFLTQDATPADSCWLECLLRPFYQYEKVAGVFSRQAPRPGSDLLEAADLHSYFRSVRQVRTLPPSEEYFRAHIWDFIQFSNASAAYERTLLLANPFRETIPMGEDQEWAKRMLESGHAIVYEPESLVLHSHEHSLAQKRKRHREMGRAFSLFLSEILGRRRLPVGAWIYNMLGDVGFILTSEATFVHKAKWVLLSPLHRAACHWAYYRGWNSVAPR
jgi:rhamnosyltransferase